MVKILSAALLLMASTPLIAGINLTFKLDENYVILYTVYKEFAPPPLTSFQNDLREKHPELVKRVRALDALNPVLTAGELSELRPLLDSGKSHASYKVLIAETRAFLVELEGEWKANYSRTLAEMEKVTKLDLEKSLSVYVTHPMLGHGRYYGNNVIGYGAKNFFPNYGTVYLWHEVMHSYLPIKHGIPHALVELMTDDHLCTFLNGGSYPPFTDYGHSDLKPFKERLFEVWLAYLQDPSENIQDLETRLSGNLKVNFGAEGYTR